MLNGLCNFHIELKIDTTSFLHDYYKKNKHLLTDEEDDDELDVDDNKSTDLTTLRQSKTFALDEKASSKNTLNKMSSTIISDGGNKTNAAASPSEIKNKGKKPILPENCSPAIKSYYESVEKVIYDIILKSYELTDVNGIKDRAK